MIHTNELKLMLEAIAAGDKAGTITEFMPQAQVASAYVKHAEDGWPFVPVAGGPFNWKASETTDDTAMALAIAEASPAKCRVIESAIRGLPWDEESHHTSDQSNTQTENAIALVPTPGQGCSPSLWHRLWCAFGLLSKEARDGLQG